MTRMTVGEKQSELKEDKQILRNSEHTLKIKII
jgi:hypothetical protein